MYGTFPLAARPNQQRLHPAPAGNAEAAPATGAASGVRPITLEDLELVDQVQNGRTEAYGELVTKYQDRVFNACWRICGHLEDARDVTQDAFIRAYENIAEFRRESGFYTWVFRIAVNLALSLRRRQQRRNAVSLDAAPAAQVETLVRQVRERRETGPEEQVEHVDRERLVVQALAAVQPQERAILVLRDIEGLDYQDIAAILDVPLGTMKSRLFRARMALREALYTLAPRVKWTDE